MNRWKVDPPTTAVPALRGTVRQGEGRRGREMPSLVAQKHLRGDCDVC